jgi:hypothetical protein
MMRTQHIFLMFHKYHICECTSGFFLNHIKNIISVPLPLDLLRSQTVIISKSECCNI